MKLILIIVVLLLIIIVIVGANSDKLNCCINYITSSDYFFLSNGNLKTLLFWPITTYSLLKILYLYFPYYNCNSNMKYIWSKLQNLLHVPVPIYLIMYFISLISFLLIILIITLKIPNDSTVNAFVEKYFWNLLLFILMLFGIIMSMLTWQNNLLTLLLIVPSSSFLSAFFLQKYLVILFEKDKAVESNNYIVKLIGIVTYIITIFNLFN